MGSDHYDAEPWTLEPAKGALASDASDAPRQWLPNTLAEPFAYRKAVFKDAVAYAT